MAQYGIEHLFKLSIDHKEKIIVLGLVSTSLVVIGSGPVNEILFSLVVSLAIAWIFIRISLKITIAVKENFGTMASIVLNWPFVLGAMFLLYRALLLIIYYEPGQSSISTKDVDNTLAIPTMWIFTFLILAINISLFSCAIGRLVQKILRQQRGVDAAC